MFHGGILLLLAISPEFRFKGLFMHSANCATSRVGKGFSKKSRILGQPIQVKD
jgi:hypothetical protein